MPVNTKHAEEYELPEIIDGPSSSLQAEDDFERERLIDGRTSEDKLGEVDAEEEQIGKGTKIDELIARVCICLFDQSEADIVDCTICGRHDLANTDITGPLPRLDILYHGRFGFSGFLLQVECALLLIILCDIDHISTWSPPGG